MNSYAKDDGSYYGAVPLDQNSMVNYLEFDAFTETKGLPSPPSRCFHPTPRLAILFVFQLCFAHKGTLKDEVGLKFTYVNAKGQILTQTAKISTVFAKGDA